MAIRTSMLRCFCTVVQTGNLAEAADRLGRTQSAISMTLRQLEDNLGKKLFEGERKNRLSPFGEQVFELALRQVRHYDQTLQSINLAAEANHGLIRIVSVPSVAALIFPSVLDHVTGLFPGVKVELRDTHTSQVIDALAEGKADIGIASGYHPLNGVTAEPLFSDRYGLIGASDHPLITQDKTLEIADIDPSVFFRNALCDLIETPAFSGILDNSDVTIQNTHSLITMVNTGRWVTVLPKTVAKFAPETVSFRPIVDLPDKRQVYLYRRERTRFKDLTDTCFDFISSLDFD